MNLFNANSEEELRKYGKLNNVRNELKKLLGSEVKIKSNNWSNLFKSITALKRISLYIFGDNNNVELLTNDIYFKGETERYIFFLLELDGEQRLEKLGVNRVHYSNKEIADKWRNGIAKIIHPDVCSHIKAEEAMAELNEMYREMLK